MDNRKATSPQSVDVGAAHADFLVLNDTQDEAGSPGRVQRPGWKDVCGLAPQLCGGWRHLPPAKTSMASERTTLGRGRGWVWRALAGMGD